MAGGPSTPALAAAVSAAGGLGFLAGGHKSVEAVQRELDQLSSLMPAGLPYGINLFAPSGPGSSTAQVSAYAARLGDEARHRGAELGSPRFDDDHYQDKLAQLRARRVPVVSFTFGCPAPADVDLLRGVGSAVWVTVTTAEEAVAAQAVGADALVVQGVEAGGHRGGFDDTRPGDVGLLALLQLVAGAVGDELPLIAGGGLATGRGVAAALAAGAAAAQIGTAFLLAAEAGTDATHRQLIGEGRRPTALTRAFTGRTARSIVNGFLEQHSDHAPSAYPQVHHLTGPLRAAARRAGDPEGFPLWAGQSYSLARQAPAAEIVRTLTTEAGAALRRATNRLSQDR